MDFKDPKVQKIALACVVFFVLIYFWYSRVYTMQATQIAAKQTEYQTMITNLRNVEMKSKSLDGLQAEYKSLQISRDRTIAARGQDGAVVFGATAHGVVADRDQDRVDHAGADQIGDIL
jgi:hypothetical protein